MLEANLCEIKMNIQKACDEIGRDIRDITILGVTKTRSIEDMKELQKLGISDFGENKAQELLEKYECFDNIRWHFIGNLQTNKVKQIIDKTYLIHSVNSIRLLNEIDKRAKQINKIANVLIEINIAREQSKEGILEEELEEILKKAQKLTNVCVKGLMCIAPFTKKPQENIQYFKKMQKLFVDIKSKTYDNIYMEYLSMGMSNDYYFAVLESSNIVRIGTAIFN